MKTKGFTWYGDGINEETDLENIRSGKKNYPGENVEPAIVNVLRPGSAGSSSASGSTGISGASSASGTGVA